MFLQTRLGIRLISIRSV